MLERINRKEVREKREELGERKLQSGRLNASANDVNEKITLLEGRFFLEISSCTFAESRFQN